MKKKSRPAVSVHSWVRLRRDAQCAYGCAMSSRRWALEVKGRRRHGYYGRRFLVCEGCAATRYNMRRPMPAPEDLPRDGKAAQVGSE
jgi:hypothetical protein